MKLRNLVLSAIAATTTTVTVVYNLTPPTGVAYAQDAPLGASSSGVVTSTAVATSHAAGLPATHRGRAAAALTVDSRLGHSRVSSEDSKTFVFVSVEGNPTAQKATPETSTILVVDRSGSMAGVRIDNARAAARQWVNGASSRDVLGLVSFDSHAVLHVPATPLAPRARQQFLAELPEIEPRGSTCISCGVELALRQFATGSDRVRRIVVLSDGQANAGLVAGWQFAQLGRDCRDSGIAVTTVGLGDRYNEETMATLAFESNGNHHFVAGARDLPALFERERKDLAATVANGTEVRIALTSGVELLRVVDRSFERRAGVIVVPLGPISDGQAKTVLLEVKLPATLGQREVASVDVNYLDAAGGSRTVGGARLTTSVQAGPSSVRDALVEMRIQRNASAEALTAASALFKQGQGQGAASLLATRLGQLRAASNRVRRSGHPRAAISAADLARQIKEVGDARDRFSRNAPTEKIGREAVRSTRRDAFANGI